MEKKRVGPIVRADVPITDAKDDLLGADKTAENIVKVVRNYEEKPSLAIGLYGSWGSGKSSVVNLVAQQLDNAEDKKKIEVMRFNPWMFTSSEQIVGQFFMQLSEQMLGHDKGALEGLAKGMRKFGAFAGKATWLGLPPGAAALLESIFAAVGDGLAKEANLGESMQKQKELISEKMKELDKKTLVIIDDLDRMSNQEICTVFQMVKATADLPNLIYLMAFDYDVVTRALGSIHDGNSDGATEAGAVYLRKIIQIPFELHPYEKVADEFVKDVEAMAKRFGCDVSTQLDAIRSMAHRRIRNLRDVVRVTNMMEQKYHAANRQVNLVDLVGITIIQDANPDVYRGIEIAELYKYDSREINAYRTSLAEVAPEIAGLLLALFQSSAPKEGEVKPKRSNLEYRIDKSDHFKNYFLT